MKARAWLHARHCLGLTQKQTAQTELTMTAAAKLTAWMMSARHWMFARMRAPHMAFQQAAEIIREYAARNTHLQNMDGRWGECVGGRVPETEICNGFDDNCDGAVDEGCQCTAGQSQICGQDTGSCRSGTQTYSAEGKWGYATEAQDPARQLKYATAMTMIVTVK